MPASSTSNAPSSPRACGAQLADALADGERAGFVGARVVDQRRDEPVGEHVELRVDEAVLRFSWGQPWQLGTAAYWAEQTRRRPPAASYALGNGLTEELAACILGGYGIPAAVGLAAFRAVREAGLLDGAPSREALEAVLRAPLTIPGRARRVHYRFAAQRAQRLAATLAILAESEPPADPHQLRRWLVTLPGVGPKTASWTVRNHCGCDDIAIVDVHVHRAGLAAGFFAADWQLPRHYQRFETAFSQVARLAGVSCAALDACIWDQLQALGPAGGLVLGR